MKRKKRAIAVASAAVAGIAALFTFFGQLLIGLFTAVVALVMTFLGDIIVAAFAILFGLILYRMRVVRKERGETIKRSLLQDGQLRTYAILMIVVVIVLVAVRLLR